MINLRQGAYPSFAVDGVQLPFNDADVGKTYKFEGIVKLDHIRAEGPVFAFEVQKLAFPEVENNNMTTIDRRKNAKMSAQGINITINTGGK